jgi:galactitol-specific phosphotransferase system IIB component
MKPLNLIFTLSLTLLLSGAVYSQTGSINNTLGTGGTFRIRTATDSFFTVTQSTGNVSLFRNMELGGDSVSTSTRGVITKDGRRFIHNYRAPGTDGFNTFIGLEAGNFTMSGIGAQASYNTGVGYRSLYSLTTGFYNSAFGYQSLYSNTTGFHNSAFGHLSLYSNTTGNFNSAFGFHSLYNTTGSQNTAIGYYAGSGITTGSNNIAIGNNAHVPSGTASNQIRLGNTSITYAGIQVAWTVTSDRRYKDNITPIGLGLGFISKLNPVSYVRKNDENKKTEYGLIAQEVEQVLKELGIENHAMLTITDEGMYELRYNDLIAPMIKAIQELKEKSDEKDIEIAKLKGENKEIKSQLNEIKKVINKLKENNDDVKKVKMGESN